MPKIDPDKFNTDPKHDQDRKDFDKMIEGSINRIAEEKKKKNPVPPEDKGFFDDLIEGLFGKGE